MRSSWQNAVFAIWKMITEVNHITTDPDTGDFKAAEDLKAHRITSTVPDHQTDTLHLHVNHRKYIRNKTAVLKIITPNTKAHRETRELSMRYQTEFKNAHQDVGYKLTRLKARICEITDAIILCYTRDHILCRTQSRVCMGERDNNCILRSAILSETFKLKQKENTSKWTVRDCIDTGLGLGFLIETILAIFYNYKSPRCFLPSFKLIGFSVREKKRKIDFQDGHQRSHLVFPIRRILTNFDLEVTLTLSFQVNWPFSSGEEAKNRFSWLPPWRQFWISDRFQQCFLPSFKSIGLSVQEKK